MKTIEKQIAEYITENIESLEEGTNLLIGQTQNEPDTLVTIFNTGGVTPDKDLPTARPTFQVRTRAVSYEEASELIHEIVALLHNKYNFKVENDANYNYVYSCNLLGEPAYIGLDEHERSEFTANFNLLTRRFK